VHCLTFVCLFARLISPHTHTLLFLCDDFKLQLAPESQSHLPTNLPRPLPTKSFKKSLYFMLFRCCVQGFAWPNNKYDLFEISNRSKRMEEVETLYMFKMEQNGKLKCCI